MLVVVECEKDPQHENVRKTTQQNYANHVRDEEIAEAEQLIREVFDNRNLRVEEKVDKLGKYHHRRLTIELYGCGETTVDEWVYMCSLDLDRCRASVFEERARPARCQRYRYISDYCYENLSTHCRNNVGAVSLDLLEEMNKTGRKKLMTNLMESYELVEAEWREMGACSGEKLTEEQAQKLLATACDRMKRTKASSRKRGMNDDDSLKFLEDTFVTVMKFLRIRNLLSLLSNEVEEKLKLPDDILLKKWRTAGAVSTFSVSISNLVSRLNYGDHLDLSMSDHLLLPQPQQLIHTRRKLNSYRNCACL